MKQACLNKASKLMIVLACGVPYGLSLKNKKYHMKELISENPSVSFDYFSGYIEENYISDFTLLGDNYDRVCDINSFDYGDLLHETGFNDYFF